MSGNIPWEKVICTPIPMNRVRDPAARRHEDDKRSPLDVILARCTNFKYVTEERFEGEVQQVSSYHRVLWRRNRDGRRFYSGHHHTYEYVNPSIHQKRIDRNISLTEGLANAMILFTKLSDWEGIDVILATLEQIKFEGLGSLENSGWLDELKANIAKEAYKQFKNSGLDLLELYFTPKKNSSTHSNPVCSQFMAKDLLKIIMDYALPNSMPLMDLARQGELSTWNTRPEMTWLWPHQYPRLENSAKQNSAKQHSEKSDRERLGS